MSIDVALLINFGALVFAIYQLLRQRKDTENLARLTSDLDHRVHRLSVHLEYEKYRLERVRDLITGLVRISVALRQKNRPQMEKLNVAVEREMTMPELMALIYTINDAELKELYQKLHPIVFNPIWPHLWNELEYDMGTVDELLMQQNNCIGLMHSRILILLERASKVE